MSVTDYRVARQRMVREQIEAGAKEMARVCAEADELVVVFHGFEDDLGLAPVMVWAVIVYGNRKVVFFD